MSQGPKRRRTENINTRIAMVAVTVVVAFLAVFLGARLIPLKEKQAQYMEKEQAVAEQVEEEKERAKELEDYRVYVQTKQYIEKIAKEKLGLVNKNEILIKPDR